MRAAYGPVPASIANNGHTIQATFENGGSLRWAESDYRLIQLHYHRPSEHTFDGRPAALEVHMVHRNAGDALAVIGVLFDVGETADPVIAALIRGGLMHDTEPIVLSIDPSSLIPTSRAYS